MTKKSSLGFRASDFGINSSFACRAGAGRRRVIRHSSSRGEAAFTLLELLVVISIIIILAGLTIGTMGYVQEKGKRSRAEAEIAAISAALESYKADNGIYPQYTSTTGSGHALYQALSGDGDDSIGGTKSSTGTTGSANKSYMALRPNMVKPNPPTSSAHVVDPSGQDYNYLSPGNYNPTFDLWTTTAAPGASVTPSPAQWIKNW